MLFYVDDVNSKGILMYMWCFFYLIISEEFKEFLVFFVEKVCMSL